MMTKMMVMTMVRMMMISMIRCKNAWIFIVWDFKKETFGRFDVSKI